MKMKFITPELYEEMQNSISVHYKRFEQKWRAACEAKLNHTEEIRSKLPESMKSFARITLHDAVIQSADRLPNGDVHLSLDGTDCPWGPVGFFDLTFRGVRDVEGLDEVVDDQWLYEEIDLHSQAAFEYRVLLSHSEFRTAADDVEFRVLQPKRRSHIVKRWAGYRAKSWNR